MATGVEGVPIARAFLRARQTQIAERAKAALRQVRGRRRGLPLMVFGSAGALQPSENPSGAGIRPVTFLPLG